MKNSELYKKITDDRNIYSAICAAKYYIDEKNLLNSSDNRKLQQFDDKFNFSVISIYIKKCKKRLDEVLLNDNVFFEGRILLKFKRMENGVSDYRPIYTAPLIDQICIMAITSQLIFNDDFDTSTRKLSDLSKCIPNNFYGNIPTIEGSRIYYKWQDKYADYTQAITDRIKVYKNSKKYLYKVSLDLKNFFPSVDKNELKNLIINKILNLNILESEIYNKILDKLINIKITNVNSDNLSISFIDNNICIEDKSYFNKGLPQGLPHSYFFANILMVEIANATKSCLNKSEAYYYVDDSTIFTNIPKKMDAESYLKELLPNIDNIIIKYGCKLNLDKCSIEEISKIKDFELYAKSITSITSVCTNELFTTNSEEEDKILLSKINALLEFIQLELNKIDIYKDSYIKKLKGYKKFYTLRQQILTTRLKYDTKLLDYKKVINKIYSGDEIDKVIDEKSFYGSINLFIPLISNKRKFINAIKDNYNNIINIGVIPEELSYFEQFCKTISTKKAIIETDYLNNIIRQNILLPQSSSNELKHKCMKDVVLRIQNKSLVETLFKEKTEFIKFMYNLSLTYRKEILNSLFSYILDFTFDKSKITQKANGRKMLTYELIILVYLRSAYSNDIYLSKLFNEILDNSLFSEENMQTIDYEILEAINQFLVYVKDPEHIRNLIIAHRYTTLKWQNGSKFLYFYTLHNQSHAIKLIQYSIQIVKSINFIEISSDEWYLLFMCCYLHDIAMTKYPDLDSIRISDLDIETQCLNLFDKLTNEKDYNNFTSLFISIFSLIDEALERNIRCNHEDNSAKMILDDQKLKLYGEKSEFLKEQIATVSKAHGEDGNVVYNELVGHTKINLKFLKIILRIADLLDGDKTRVNPIFFDDNVNNMPDISKFHWYSHSIVDSCTIDSKYRVKNDKLIEDIYITINLNYYVNIKTSCHKDKSLCPKESTCKFKLEFDGKEVNDIPCNIMTKWFCEKNNWLYNEMNLLVTYLDRVDQAFESNVHINYTYNENSNSFNYYPFINEFLSNK